MGEIASFYYRLLPHKRVLRILVWVVFLPFTALAASESIDLSSKSTNESSKPTNKSTNVAIKKTPTGIIDRTETSSTLKQKMNAAIDATIDAEITAQKNRTHSQKPPIGPPEPIFRAGIAIEPQFEAVGLFYKGSAPAKKDGKWGLIDIHGGWVLAPTFSEIGKYTEGGLLPVKANGKYGYIDASGTPITDFIYEDVKPFSEGLAAVKQEGEWGYILPDGQWYIKPGFENAGSFKQGVAPIQFAEGWGYALRKWSEGATGRRWLLEPFYQKTFEFSDNHGVFKVNNLMGLVDDKKNIVIKPTYSNMKRYSEGVIAVSMSPKEWFFVDNKGNKVIDDVFTATSSFSEGLVRVKKNDKWGYINKENKTVIPFQYDRAYDFHEGVAVVVMGKDRFFIDKRGHVLSYHYSDVYRMSESYAAVKVGDVWGYIFIPNLADKADKNLIFFDANKVSE